MSHEIKIGELLDNRFEITGLIEQTGLATIFKALDTQTRQVVVIKLPHAEFEGTANSSRFAREAATLEKLDHPGIPGIIRISEKSRPYVVMEYVEGQTLYDILRRRRSLAPCEALHLASRLCDIVEYIHRQGIIHGDLKPGNIMISNAGRPHLVDFGIAQRAGMFSPKMGTPEYMAPEQIQGDRLDARTDVYALGAVLYEMVTGAHPFPGDTSDDIFDARMKGMPRPPRELDSNLSEQVEEIILHAMAPRPSDRYSSAAAMKAEVDSPATVHVTGKYRNPRKASSWPKRLRVTAFVLSAAMAPIILFFLFLLMFQRQPGR